MPRLIDLRVEHQYREGLCCGLPEISHRKRDRRKDTRSNRERIWIKETICIDGEGRTNTEGIHYYTLLAGSDSTGSRKWSIRSQSLSSRQCFEFLLLLPSSTRKVSFSFDYDVNMILKDVPLSKLQKLHDKGYVYWHGYRIGWIPRKQFSVSVKRPVQLGGTKKCVVWDMFGYFQKSFSRTLHEWQVGTDDERKLIANMKAKRSTFTEDESDKILEYCLLECKLGAQTFDKLLESTESVGLNLTRYDGAGSVAAAMLHKHGIKQYIDNDKLPIEVALKGYFGGRFDHSRFGKIGDAYEYDINSAYPNIARNLPCLSHSEWRYTTEYSSISNGIWHVEWCIQEPIKWGPFPYRSKGRVYYWRSGRGWYWHTELREAMRLFHAQIRIIEGWTYVSNCEHKPFGFIEQYFEERRKLKERGDLAQLVLKLGLNSLYGKTAQSKGRHQPPYQSFIWAGMITAGTRAMLLSALRQAGNDAVLTATDAVISTRELDLDIGDGLGQWERKICKNLFIVQNGVYESVGSKVATRGFAPADLSFGAIRNQAAKESRFDVVVHETRFIGLGEALARNPPLTNWRRWIEGDSRVRYGYYPDRDVDVDRNLWLRENPCTEDSEPFEPKFSTNVGTNSLVSVLA